MKKATLVAIAGSVLLGSAAAAQGFTHADAAKPPRPAVTAGGSISLNQANPRLGDWVTFSSSVPTGTNSPRIQVICRQNGAVVYAEAASASSSFKLGGGSSAWLASGGPANCEATLYSWDFKPVQTMVTYAVTAFGAGG